MTITEFLSGMDDARSSILNKIHQIIIAGDKNVEAAVGQMMGKKMIIYKEEGIFKYALASSKEYLSLHIMAIYGSPLLHAKYKALLSKARFQKGCINFKSDLEMPSTVVADLIKDSAKINMKKFFENLRMKRGKD